MNQGQFEKRDKIMYNGLHPNFGLDNTSKYMSYTNRSINVEKDPTIGASNTKEDGVN